MGKGRVRSIHGNIFASLFHWIPLSCTSVDRKSPRSLYGTGHLALRYALPVFERLLHVAVTPRHAAITREPAHSVDRAGRTMTKGAWCLSDTGSVE